VLGSGGLVAGVRERRGRDGHGEVGCEGRWSGDRTGSRITSDGVEENVGRVAVDGRLGGVTQLPARLGVMSDDRWVYGYMCVVGRWLWTARHCSSLLLPSIHLPPRGGHVHRTTVTDGHLMPYLRPPLCLASTRAGHLPAPRLLTVSLTSLLSYINELLTTLQLSKTLRSRRNGYIAPPTRNPLDPPPCPTTSS
jgi:hypothetical protein